MTIRFATILGLATLCGADILYENDLITPSEVFDLKYALDSGVGWEVFNKTKYYCVFRNLWTPEDHPKDYPDLARWSTPAIFSHSKQYSPFIKNREANYGVEVIAEVRLRRLLVSSKLLESPNRSLLSSRFPLEWLYDQVPRTNHSSWRFSL